MGYHQTGAVYTCRSGSVQIQPDRPPISVRARIGSKSKKTLNHPLRKLNTGAMHCTYCLRWLL